MESKKRDLERKKIHGFCPCPPLRQIFSFDSIGLNTLKTIFSTPGSLLNDPCTIFCDIFIFQKSVTFCANRTSAVASPSGTRNKFFLQFFFKSGSHLGWCWVFYPPPKWQNAHSSVHSMAYLGPECASGVPKKAPESPKWPILPQISPTEAKNRILAAILARRGVIYTL